MSLSVYPKVFRRTQRTKITKVYGVNVKIVGINNLYPNNYTVTWS